jgi:anti-sigma factor RsiW
LVDLAEGRLPPGEQAPLEAHLATCPQCSGEVAELERLIHLMRTDLARAAPPAVIARAVRLFRSRAAAPLVSGLRRTVLAALRFDSQGLAPAFGVRSGEPCARQLLFVAEDYDIDLRIEPAGQAWIVSGQVFGEMAAGGWAELQDATSAKQTPFNAQSEFELPAVPAGLYRLILNLPTVEVKLEGLRLGP